jgi:DNA-binding response OmpR family regulator
MGYLVTPAFSLRKALHAVQMIQFDLIVTWTVVNPDDRRTLTGELKRYSPDAVLILVADPDSSPTANGRVDGVDAVVHRPFTVQDVRTAIDSSRGSAESEPAPSRSKGERRKRATA